MQSRYVSGLLVLLAFLGYADQSYAQVPTGKYQVVGAMNNGSGFYGVVNIQKAGPISFTVQHKTNEKYTMKGRVTTSGYLEIYSASRSGDSGKVTGRVNLKNKRYGVSSNFSVSGIGRGVFVVVKI
jgi:hypothetical protein